MVLHQPPPSSTILHRLAAEPPLTASPSSFELEIVATGRPRLVQSLRELWAYRGTILAFAERDIRVNYKQAALGLAWAWLEPLAFRTSAWPRFLAS